MFWNRPTDGKTGHNADVQATEPKPSDSDRRGENDSHRLGSTVATPPIPKLVALDAEQHALELLDYMQGPGGRTGTITARELAEVHLEMCSALDIEIVGWTAVGRELRRLLGQRKLYADHQGRRVRVYQIPPASADLRQRSAARWSTPAAGTQGVKLPPARAA